MLGEDYLRDVLRVLLGWVALFPILAADIDIFAVNECDHIGVLLDAAAFAQVGEERAMVGTLLNCAAELGASDYRNVEVTRHGLNGAGNLAHFLRAVVDAPTAAD